MVKYVAGLLFDEDRNRVALILKNHGPAAVVGHWNAIGGKRSTASAGQLESSAAAMWREFIEEAGVDIQSWEPFLILRAKGDNPEWQVDFFHAFDYAKLGEVKTMESESVMVWHLDELTNIVSNLAWIIPMALTHKSQHVHVYECIHADCNEQMVKVTA
jgi:8-oxo-dGTP pyrophosphatase MutT (NUDIX family)